MQFSSKLLGSLERLQGFLRLATIRKILNVVVKLIMKRSNNLINTKNIYIANPIYSLGLFSLTISGSEQSKSNR
jgi:hypothetical protein